MNAFWMAPLALAGLALAWAIVQRCWVRLMEQPGDTDALARPGCCGAGCGRGSGIEVGAPCIAAASCRVASTREESPP